MNLLSTMVRRVARTLAVLLLVISGATFLVRFAPGYLSDAREMDARYAQVARAELSAEAERSHSPGDMIFREITGWIHGDAGISRQFGVPVAELIRPRLAVSGMLIVRAVLAGWSLAIVASLLSASMRRSSMLWQVPSSLLLAVPIAAMATVCLLTSVGGAALVMALLLAAQDFKFLHRTLRRAWQAPEVFQARAQGTRPHRLLMAHVLPVVAPRVLALAALSVTTALSALVPVEVIFDIPGLGQLAWNAALNRDLPVLLAVTMIMSLAVTLAGMTPGQRAEWSAT